MYHPETYFFQRDDVMGTADVAETTTGPRAGAATQVRPKGALTARAIETAKPGAVLWDEQVTGLQLRVSAAGRKSFYLYYRTRTGAERRPKLGDLGVFTLATAREAAREWLAKVALGVDPADAWRAERGAPTVAMLCDLWLSVYARKAKPKTFREAQRIVEKYIRPRLGKLKAADVRDDDIETVHEALRSTPYMANRVLATESILFNYAEKKRLRPPGSNPCRHVERYPETNRTRYMARDEAPLVAAALARHEAARPQPVAFIHLLILSGARPDEIARARPEWVEPVGDGGVLRLPDSKVGARPVYLPPQVMRLVAQLPRTSRGTLLQIKSPKALWDEIRAETGIKDLRLYDLRHTFASAALKAGYSLAQIGELLGHASTQTTKRYAHLIEDQAHEAVTRTAGLLEQMMKGGTE